MKHALMATALGLAALLAAPSSFARDAAARWTPAEAKAWYAKQSWPLGSNYLPANAIKNSACRLVVLR